MDFRDSPEDAAFRQPTFVILSDKFGVRRATAKPVLSAAEGNLGGQPKIAIR